MLMGTRTSMCKYSHTQLATVRFIFKSICLFLQVVLPINPS